MKTQNRKTIAAALLALGASLTLHAQETTPAMVAAAEKEGKVVWYTAVDVKVAEGIAKLFREQYPKIPIEVERSGSERVFQRVNQELQSNIRNADVVNSSDASHFLHWKQQKLLASHTPPDVQKFAAQYKDPDGCYAVWRATLSVMAYNTNLVKESDAPKGYLDLLDPKWNGKLVKAHPSYSGTSLTGTYALVKALGWGLLREARQERRAAVAVHDRPAEEHRERRARRHGGRQRVQHVHRDRPEEPGEDHLREGRHAVRDFPHRDLRRRTAPERRARVPELPLHRKSAAGAGRPGRRALRAPGREGARESHALKDIKLLPDDPAGKSSAD